MANKWQREDTRRNFEQSQGLDILDRSKPKEPTVPSDNAAEQLQFINGQLLRLLRRLDVFLWIFSAMVAEISVAVVTAFTLWLFNY